MKSSHRDIAILKKIVSYCDDVDESIRIFGNNYDSFTNINPYKHSVTMCILQIGELVTKLSDSLKETYSVVP